MFKYLFYKFYKFQRMIGDALTIDFDVLLMIVFPLLLYFWSGVMLHEYFFSDIGSPFSRETAVAVSILLLTGLYVFFYFLLLYKKKSEIFIEEYEKRFKHVTSFWAILYIVLSFLLLLLSFYLLILRNRAALGM